MTYVYLAVGHGDKPDGRHDPGAQGGGWSEQSAGDVIVATAARLLSDVGVTVSSEANVPDPAFVGTVAKANARGADLLVTIHHDTAGAPRGAFAYYHPGSTQGRKLATSIVDALAPVTGTRNAWKGPGLGTAAGPVTSRNLYVLRESKMPAVLVEIGPIGALDRDGLERAGVAVAEGIANYLGIPTITVATKDDAMALSADDLAKVRHIIRDELLNVVPSNLASEIDRLRIGQRALHDYAGIDLGTEGP